MEPTPRPIMEDDPGWDCRTMGNLMCGPDDPPGAVSAHTMTLPDTAVAPPVGPDLTGPIVVIVLLVTLVTDRVRAR